MTKVVLTQFEDGSEAFAGGEVGEPYFFERDDEDSLTVAFTKAVNDIIERREEVEGEAAVQVAEVLKAASGGALGDGYNELREKVQAALPKSSRGGGAELTYEGSDYYVIDIALDARHALICKYGTPGGGPEHYVVPFEVVSDQVIVGDKSQWVEVEEQFVAKAGRMFSARNLTALQEAHDALATLIERGIIKPEAVDGGEEGTQKAEAVEGEFAYTVEKSDAAMRYTLGPLYAPMREDAHGEWIEDEALHKALHEYVRDSSEDGRRINLQHNTKGEITVGEWVECVRWPYEHTIKVTNSKGEAHEVTMPEGTVYLGVVWDKEYWDDKTNTPKGIDGYSLGGRAMKVRGTSETLKDMGYKVSKSEAPVEKAEAHEYDGGKDGSGPCTSCGKSKADGNHLPEPTSKSEELPEASPEAVQEALELTATLAKERAKREAAEGEVERNRGLLGQVLDVFTKQAEAKPGETHIHLPEQNVIINEAHDDDDPVET